MSFDDLAADRQTETHAGRLTFHKGLEKPFGYVRRDARASVSNRDLHHFPFRHSSRPNYKLAPLDLLHRFDGIAHEVENHLLNLHMIHEYGRQSMIELK